MRLIAEPRGVTGRRYCLTREGAPICEISFPSFGPSVASPIAGQTYRVRRVGALRARFTLAPERGGEPLATLTQRDALRRDYILAVGERRLDLRAESPLHSGYLLLEEGREVGVIHPSGALRRGVTADLPDDLELAAGVFLLWVILLLWRGRRVMRA